MTSPLFAGAFQGLDMRPNAIERLRRVVSAYPDYLDLTSANPTSQGLLFPAELVEHAAAAYWQTRRYRPDPRGNEAARAAIARWYATRNPATVIDPSAIWLTASTSESYALLFALLADPGDTLLAPVPSYPLFDYLAELRSLELSWYHLDEARGWAIDETSLQANERTRSLLLISPHNPTGKAQRQRNETIARLGLPLICDEVFDAFPYAAETLPTCATLYPDLPVFLLNGLSKLFALPDIKLGWIALNEPAYRRYADRLDVLNDTLLSASGPAQALVPTLFDVGMPFVEAMAARIHTNLDYALEAFRLHPAFDVQVPDGGYYLFPKVNTELDEEELTLHLLERAHLLVHPGFFFGQSQGTHIALSALVEPEAFREGVQRLCRTI